MLNVVPFNYRMSDRKNKETENNAWIDVSNKSL